MNGKDLLKAYESGRRDFRDIEITGENLRNADLSGCDFSYSGIEYCDLEGADLTGCKLAFVGFTGTNLDKVKGLPDAPVIYDLPRLVLETSSETSLEDFYLDVLTVKAACLEAPSDLSGYGSDDKVDVSLLASAIWFNSYGEVPDFYGSYNENIAWLRKAATGAY